jgi:hypothetical protein
MTTDASLVSTRPAERLSHPGRLPRSAPLIAKPTRHPRPLRLPGGEAIALFGPWTDVHVHFPREQRLPALGTGHHRIEHFAAELVLIDPRPAALIDHVNVAPVHNSHDDRL